MPLTLAGLDRTPPNSVLLSAIASTGAALCPLVLPSLWPCPDTHLLQRLSGSGAWLSWNEAGLHALFDVRGPFLPARDTAHEKQSIHADSRVEVFVCPASTEAESGSGVMRYRGFEFNSAGRCLDFAVSIDETGERQFDYAWTGTAVGLMQHDEDGSQQTEGRLYRVSIPWQDIGVSSAVSPGEELLVGLYRGEVIDPTQPAQRTEHVWTCWVDPLSPDVTFHTPRTFARVRLKR